MQKIVIEPKVDIMYYELETRNKDRNCILQACTSLHRGTTTHQLRERNNLEYNKGLVMDRPVPTISLSRYVE